MDRKYYSNVFIIYGQEGGLIFSSKDKDAIIARIQEEIFNHQMAKKIDVIGTFQRPEKYKKGIYVVYVVEIEIEEYY